MNSNDTEEDAQVPRVPSKELRNLQSFNRPGTMEESTSENIRRARLPTLTAARTQYEIAKDSMKESLDHLDDSNKSALLENHLREDYILTKMAERGPLKL